MNANCLDEKRNFKACPYRVITKEHKAVLRGYGDLVVGHAERLRKEAKINGGNYGKENT